jgi:hypothetical protein
MIKLLANSIYDKECAAERNSPAAVVCCADDVCMLVLLLLSLSSSEAVHVKEHFYSSLAHMPDYAKLKFHITGVEKVHNKALEDTFYASMRHFHQQRYPYATEIVYHSTKPANIPAIIKENLRMDKAGQLDSGWFGKGLYFSKHADYVMQYFSTGAFRRVKVGDKGKILRFDILPGRMNQLKSVTTGIERKDGCDSHVSPNNFEYVMFDARHILLQYVLSFEVLAAPGAIFDGSAEQMGDAD